MVLVKIGRGAEAVGMLRYALEREPRDLETTRVPCGWPTCAAKQDAEAVAGFREILERDPKSQIAMNSLAWIEATSGDDKLRNGKEAVELAEKAAAVRSRHEPDVLDTLAAAYAEAGRFPEAAAAARKAKDAAPRSAINKPMAEGIEARIRLYEAHKPYRDPMLVKP